MTPEEHRQRHITLHRALDELFADYIGHHPQQSGFLDTPIRALIEWSHAQTIEPADLRGSKEDPNGRDDHQQQRD
jgi:hypothetical protein